MKLTRDLFEPYVDLDGGKNAAEGKYRWGRVRKSTTFELSANAQEETYGFIDSPNDTTEVSSYQPQLPLESIPESTDEVYAFMQDYLFKFPLGSDTQVPFLLKYPIIKKDAEGKSTGEIDPDNRNAIIWDEAVVSNLALNTVDQKATWTEMLNGIPKRGTMPVGGADPFVFTPDDGTVTPTPPTEVGDEGGTPSRARKSEQ